MIHIRRLLILLTQSRHRKMPASRPRIAIRALTPESIIRYTRTRQTRRRPERKISVQSCFQDRHRTHPTIIARPLMNSTLRRQIATIRRQTGSIFITRLRRKLIGTRYHHRTTDSLTIKRQPATKDSHQLIRHRVRVAP